ncbi:MAG: mechanosensitive ion channel [Desulfobacteraceae bacterium]|jgi:potassium-dependent mechanosensitive channel|nr:mechanosensitive ion channel [Desulfobacteraceae bacterium]
MISHIRFKKSLCLYVMIALFGLMSVSWAAAPKVLKNKQSPTEVNHQKPSPEIDPADIELKLNGVKKSVVTAEASENQQTSQQLGITLPQLQERTVKLRELNSVYQRLLTALKKKKILEKEEALLKEKKQTQQQVTLSKNPPYSLSFYDTILDKLITDDHKKETAILGIRLAEKALADAREKLDDSGQDLRKSKEKLGEMEPGEVTGKLRWELDQARLTLETAQAIFDLQRATRQNLSIEVRLAEQNEDVTQQNLVWVSKNLHFDNADLEKQIEAINRNRDNLQKRQKDQLRGQMKVETAWLQAQERLANVRKKTDIALAKARLEAADAQREASQQLLEQTEDMLNLLNQQEQVWRNRYALVKDGVDQEKIDAWKKEIEAGNVKIERTLRLQESYQNSLQPQITSLEKQLSDQGYSKDLRREFENRLDSLRTLEKGGVEYLSMLQATLRLNQRLLDQIIHKGEHFDLWKKLTKVTGKVTNIWDLELWVIDEHGVTVKKLVMALIILIVGFIFVKRIFLFWVRRLLARVHMKETTTAAVEKIINYIVVFLIILFALRVVNMPLTLFTFLGGAVAIGVGFGAQNLINNFISGFIVMAEQPIKIGDLVEIEGMFAMVEEIGARCTRIRTGGNVQILVPNSSFLEKNIINWTLSDKEVRAQVTVGVIYGSPVREVERLMLQVADEHTRVRKAPKPFVLFNDFGDNSLVFDLYFWISMNRIMDRRIIESDIRFHIDELFREAGIVIAFPQRDVHLDTQKPLEFRLVKDQGDPNAIAKE